MTKTIVSDISVDELYAWLSDEGNRLLVERSSEFVSTFTHYLQLDPVTKLPTPQSNQAHQALNNLRSHLAVYQLVSERIELIEGS